MSPKEKLFLEAAKRWHEMDYIGGDYFGTNFISVYYATNRAKERRQMTNKYKTAKFISGLMYEWEKEFGPASTWPI